MLDSDLANLYNVETRVLNQAVKRNIDRFPKKFRFQLTKEELTNLRFQDDTLNQNSSNLISQIVTSNSKHGGKRKLPFVFTEQGVSMLSAVLRSETVYHFGASLKDLGKKWFAFSKLEMDAKDLIEKLGDS